MAAESERRGGQHLPRSRRLTHGTEIRGIFRRGKRSRTPHLDVFDSASPRAFSRAGVVVPRYGRHVVDRNRVKRRLREILRREVLPALDSAHVAADVLVRARREAYDVAYGQLRDELVIWVEKRCSDASCSE